MSEMEVLNSKVDLLTTQVTTLEGLLRQALEERLLVPLPPQPIPAVHPLPTPPQRPQPPQPVQPVPQRNVGQLNRTPRQPAVEQRFPKTWTDLLRAWRRAECDSFVNDDQRVWNPPLRQAFFKRRYLMDHLRATCRTARGDTMEARENATAASLDLRRGGTLYAAYNNLHRADAGIQRQQKRPRVEPEEEQQQPTQPTQPAQPTQPQQRQRQRNPQPRRRRGGPQQEQMFQNWAHPQLVVRPRPQQQSARIAAEVARQRSEAQARAAGAALINALPEQADILNDNVVAELAAIHRHYNI
jgi:hypothetical protein